MTRLAIGLVTVFAVSLSAAGRRAGAKQRRELRVAYITPVVTAPSPRDLWGQGLLGFHRAVKDFEIRGQVFQPDPNNWGKMFTSVVRQKFDLIFPGVPTTDRDYALLLRLMDTFSATRFVVAQARTSTCRRSRRTSKARSSRVRTPGTSRATSQR